VFSRSFKQIYVSAAPYTWIDAIRKDHFKKSFENKILTEHLTPSLIIYGIRNTSEQEVITIGVCFTMLYL